MYSNSQTTTYCAEEDINQEICWLYLHDLFFNQLVVNYVGFFLVCVCNEFRH